MLKIDLAKAFDRLEWNFIVSALTRKGMHGHFINLIHACLSSPTFSVVINGQPFAKFRGDRGIRQGCPLSPYLFVLAINELSIALQEAMSANSLTGISLGPNCPSIHSLLFADDLLVCGQASTEEATQIKNILQTFFSRSGQIPNWSKSGIIFSKNVPAASVQSIKHIFPVVDIDGNFTHLGHPLIIPGKDRAAAYNFVLEKFRSKLSTYKADKLSHAARLELIKSVFASIPVYYMSNILFTKKFITKLNAIIRSFWWTGVREETNSRSLCLRAWKDICAPKDEGGLGIRNLQAMNQALILMAAWRLADHPNDFLHAVLKSKYYPDSSIWRPKPNIPKSALWASILKVLPVLKTHSFYQLTSGQLSIWSTPWCSGWANIYDALIPQPEGYVYPGKVKQLWLPNQCEWNTQLIDSLFEQYMADAIKQTPILQSEENDMLCWKLTSSGKCNTKSAYHACLKRMQELGEPAPRQINAATTGLLKRIWKCKEIAPRVQAFGWRFLRKDIPSGARAGKYSKHISSLCSRCGLEEDDTHLFFTCHFARAAWFSAPWFIRSSFLVANADSLTQIMLNLLNMNHPHASLENILTFMWCLWKSRNDNLFGRKPGAPHQIHQMATAMLNNLELSNTLQTNSMQDQQLNGAQDPPSSERREHSEAIRQSSNNLPSQGNTLRSDLLITGTKIFSDAAWKTKKVPGMASRIATGIGVYCQILEHNFSATALIQASMPLSPSVIQAEAEAFLLAAKIANRLHIQQPVFLTDNSILAKAAAAPAISDSQVPWEIRRHLAQYKLLSASCNASVYHVNRGLNGVAHNCSHQA
jgi:hypothetical protein